MTTITKNIPTTYYIASDGREFTSALSCQDYEDSLTATYVYIISPNKPGLTTIRGVHVFSSYDNAALVLATYARPKEWEIVELQVDKHLYRIQDEAPQI